MTDRDFLAEAVAELYSADPEEFIERRAALAAHARDAGETPAAKGIGGLRRPTRSAWVVNQLARSESSLSAQLTGLGDELRAAQDSLDGALMRELSVRRRKLIDALAQQAFAAAGQHAPPAALRDEVTSTLGAALADPGIAEQLQAGTLVRAAQPDGFGAGSGPTLTLVPASPAVRSTPKKKQAPPAAPRPSAAAAAAQAKAKAEAAAERRRQMLAEAEQRAAEADLEAEEAAGQERELEHAIELIEDHLTEARQQLDQARLQARRARVAQRAARQALGRLQK